jgi:putative oxidoreductase
VGLLILRMAAAFSLLGVEQLVSGFGEVGTVLLRGVVVAAAVPLLIGFGTPLAAVVQAAVQLAAMVFGRRYEPSAVLAAALGLALAMLGPGAWSLDARLFGRKRIV